ncbi:hypothetical protein JOY44_11490 [Phormidium sp. CLA17]|uniref:hypothetical protein n=1 Tax=Leptolyngbya sp. Cla-17 TaxID=2803751 RepID=UPI0019339A70|nr:hypothetical protein [Leptolyngbya sp. Cla-17]MBM0742235.1 hypothetical protein [Leptolyngbya sp. Cla-17]
MTSAVAVIMVGTIASLAESVPITDGQTVNGFIRAASRVYQFKNLTRPGTAIQTARGDEYTFTAQRGDSLEVAVTAEDGSALRPAIALIDPTGRQVSYSENPSFFKYQIVRPGTYKLLVLSRNRSLGRYTVAIDGLSAPAVAVAVPSADRVMRNTLRLRPIGCGIPNVAKIRIGTEERCTRDIEAGVYTYEEASQSIKIVDARRDLIAKQLQVTVLERCPATGTPVAQITMTEPQDGRDYTYCATPNRYVQAGGYRYNSIADTLTPLSTTSTGTIPPTTTLPPTTQLPTDSRRQQLQRDYGLAVLDSCPAARDSYVVVNFPESNQIYQYCAPPTRFLTAGEYTYNPTTGNLDAAAKPANCTVTIGGICIVK